jgi:hypothetical protein
VTIERTVLNYPIRAEIAELDSGLSVLLIGGCRSHVGSVSVAQPGKRSDTITFPEHREQAVSQRWAETLADKCHCTVAVTCGIHYDALTPDGLTEVMAALDEMLEISVNKISI